MRVRKFAAVVVFLSAACAGDSPVAVDRTIGPQAATAVAVDVSGAWEWSAREHLTFPAWVATGIIGIQPEGPITIAHCTTSGTLNLTQSGSDLSGSSEVTDNECMTTGGQAFVGAALFVPATVTGRIQGLSVRLEVSSFPVLCNWHSVVTNSTTGGAASSLDGGGRCIVPGHPKSPVPGFDPPPGGTSKSLEWTAVRP